MKCKNIPAEFHRERVGVAASADARFTHNKIEEWIDNLDIHAYGRLCPKIVDAPPVLDLDFLSILSLKKRAVEHNSSLVPLMKEVRREETQDEDDFVTLINRPTPKPWVPLRELQEDTPYPIIAAREVTNQHGRRVILKIRHAGSNLLSEVYLPQRFASCISAEKIEQFNKNCKNLALVVTHKSGNWSDIKIVKH